MYRDNQLILIILLLFNQYIAIVQTCSIIKLTTPEELVYQAYAIVQARAINYVQPPVDPNEWGTYIDRSPIISFKVEEKIKGFSRVPDPLLIEGYLNQIDDFNDDPPPYKFVRSNGQTGSCFASTYKQNASFLLFLNDRYTPYWDPLTPVNEQLHSPPANDKWLQWVKAQVLVDFSFPISSGANRLRPFFS